MSAARSASAAPDRRTVLKLVAASALVPGFAVTASAPPAHAADGGAHGLSVFGDLKYAADFSHFSYADPAAPKGGRHVTTPSTWAFNQSPLTYNTFNGFVLKGDAPPRIEITFDSLMVRALDEPDAVYGLVARSVSVSDDGNAYTFDLRPEARFHDGSPLTAEDVAFAVTLLKDKGHPNIGQVLRELESVEAVAPDKVVFTFTGRQSRDLPLFVTQLPILSKAYYSDVDFEASTLVPPLGSGPYKIGDYGVGRYVDYVRVEDWWARDLPVSVGHYNFDVIRLEFFRDRQVAFEAFKKGSLTLREEFTSKTWATEYNFPAVTEGRVVRENFPDDRPSGAQGFFLNTRRPVFADPRVREALDYAFDFEWSNKNLFFDLYKRTGSFFENSTMKASGPPSAEELALLEPFRGQVPEEVFGEPYVPPVSDGSGQDRRLLRRASQLLTEAGWKRSGEMLRNEAGATLDIEFLERSKQFERIVLPFIKNLKLLGVNARFRLVDPAQFQSRLKDFDFDVTTRRYALSSTPGESIRQFWGSAAADISGSNNLSGIRSEAIDAMIEKIIEAPDRPSLEIAARALDRLLRAGRYWVPQWYKGSHNMAMWDVYGYPETKPKHGFPVDSVWWRDTAKTEAIGFEG
ncbi:MAG: extracellular solute-binding protein [Pseudomonadota bacterium]